MFADVAIVTQHLHVVREAIFDEPSVEVLSPPHFWPDTSLRAAILVHMIEGEHCRFRLATANTMIAVVSVNDVSQLRGPLSAPLVLDFAVLEVVPSNVVPVDFGVCSSSAAFSDRMSLAVAIQAVVRLVLLAAALLRVDRRKFGKRFL